MAETPTILLLSEAEEESAVLLTPTQTEASAGWLAAYWGKNNINRQSLNNAAALAHTLICSSWISKIRCLWKDPLCSEQRCSQDFCSLAAFNDQNPGESANVPTAQVKEWSCYLSTSCLRPAAAALIRREKKSSIHGGKTPSGSCLIKL